MVLAVTGTGACVFAGAFLAEWASVSAPLVYLGRCSLPLFAVHLPLLEIGRPVGKRCFPLGTAAHDVVVFLTVLLLSVVVGSLLTRLFPGLLGRYARPPQRPV